MKLQPRERKFVIVAIASAVAFLTLEFVVLPGADHVKVGSEHLFQAQKDLRNSRELIAAKQLREQVTALRTQLDEQNHRLLSVPDANQAGAEFLTWLTTAASQRQLTFTRSEFLPVVPLKAKYRRVPVRIELTGRMTEITQFLAAITSSDRLVSIDELDLNSAGDKEKHIRCSLVASALAVAAE